MDLLQTLADSPVASALRQPGAAYPLVNAAHIMSLGLVFGTATLLDLRLLGLFGTRSVRDMGPPLSQAAALGVALALTTGVLLFSVRPTAYVGNSAFLLKLAFVGLGIANALVLRANPHWRRVLNEGEIHITVKASAIVSLAAWMSAIVAGRWIAFL